MKPAIVVGNVTNHGGLIRDGESRWLVDGKAAHLGGMSHYCPKCKVISKAIPDPHSLDIFGKLLIVAGNKSTCGAEFLSDQFLLVVGTTSSQYPSIQNTNNNSSFLSSVPYFDEQFHLTDSNGSPLVEMFYSIKFESGEISHGTTDSNGYTKRYKTDNSEKLEIYLGHIENNNE